jgi:hypothetical protein
LVINNPETEFFGLFSIIIYGEISDLGLVDVDIDSGDAWGVVGAFTGVLQEGTIKNSYSSGSVNGSYNVGGLVGNFESSSINNCYSSGSVSGGSAIGGLAGYSYHSHIISSYSNANVVGTSERVGGLAGFNGGYMGSLIANSSFLGNVQGTDSVGGIVGYGDWVDIRFSYSSGNIEGRDGVGGIVGIAGGEGAVSSYSIGNVSGTNYVGGIVGDNYALNFSNSYAFGNVVGNSFVGGAFGYLGYGTISNVYSKGSVSGSSDVGGFLGKKDEEGYTFVLNSFYDSETSGQSDNDGRGVPKTTAQMKDILTFSGATWDIEINTEDDLNDGYPFLSWQVGDSTPVWYIRVKEPICVPEEEICDGIDNNCDGIIDENFDFDFDLQNCGGCGIVCGEGEICELGQCFFSVVPQEGEISIEKVVPIQVIENPDANKNGELDFVESKPVMVRTFFKLTETDSLEKVKFILEIYDDSDKSLVYKMNASSDLKSFYSLKEEKNGQNSVNFFLENKWKPLANKKYSFRVIADPDSEIVEKNKQDNVKNSPLVEVGTLNKKIKVYPKMYDIKHENIGEVDIERAKKTFRDSIEFMERIYPVFSGGLISANFRVGETIEGLEKLKLNKRKQVQKAQQKIAELRKTEIWYEYTHDKPEKKRIFFSILPWEIFYGTNKIAVLEEVKGKDPKWNAKTPKYPVILVPSSKGKYLSQYLAVRYANFLGMKSKEPNILGIVTKGRGKLASDGWCLEPDTGKSCGARINIYDKALIGEKKNRFVLLNEIDLDNRDILGLRYFDLLAYAPDENKWISKESYEELIEKLVEFEND